MISMRYPISFALVLLLAISAAAEPRKRKHSRNEESASAGDFSYYLLSMSWAPDFCAGPTGDKDPRECGRGRKVGFVVHGLWPQSEQGRGPQRCGSARPVSQAIIDVTLRYVPTESLIQHEWANHGTCSGLTSADYFAALRRARDSIKIPAMLQAPAQEQELAPAQIEDEFAKANPSFPKAAFRVSCTRGQLQEARICFNKDLSPRACTDSAGECAIGQMTVLPVQ